MPKSRLGLLVGAATGAALLPVGAASAAYGPVAPPGGVVPGGFSDVVVAKTIGADGGSLRARIPGAEVRVRIPGAALDSPLQLAVTRARTRGIRGPLRRSGFGDRSIEAAAGIVATRPSGRGSSRLPRGIKTTIDAPGVRDGDKVLRFDPVERRFRRVWRATVHDGIVVSRSRHAGAFVVVSDRGSARR